MSAPDLDGLDSAVDLYENRDLFSLDHTNIQKCNDMCSTTSLDLIQQGFTLQQSTS